MPVLQIKEQDVEVKHFIPSGRKSDHVVEQYAHNSPYKLRDHRVEVVKNIPQERFASSQRN